MANIAEILGRLTAEELNGLRGLGPQGHLTKPLVEALDRAAGGAGAGRGYYVPTGSVSDTGGPHLVLRSDVSAWLFGTAAQVPHAGAVDSGASDPAASDPAASDPAARQ
ncbi:MAG TPA: hypothetical protein VJ617_20945 [Arthrobacter sp.]|nr:hypothetical protein [Arthrobacter sp.]